MARSDEEFLVWLQKAPRDFRAILAYRCAMRVVPLFRFVRRPSEYVEQFALLGMRALLAQAVVIIGQRKLPNHVLTSASNVESVREFAEGATFSSGKTFADGKLFATGPGYALQSAADAVLVPTLGPIGVFEIISRASEALSVRPSGLTPDLVVNAREGLASCIDDDIAFFAGVSSGAAILRAPITLHQWLDRYFSEWTAERTDLFGNDGVWTFWAKWYQRAMAGDPLPWDLQEKIALIPNEIWEAGPEAVAEQIALIEAAFELRRRIADLEAGQAVAEQGRHGIGGNNPPEEIDDAVVGAQVSVMWESIAGLKEEVEADEPDSGRVAALIERLSHALKAVVAWIGRKADLAVDTAIKWGIPAGGGFLVLNPEKAHAVLKAAQAWLPFLGP
ncbi:hypothetical protein [Gymnodinialimonas ulvae]|uniref:hypothetical protein n=1 Tax=Gymnodinialimonas ulvae TaxID=3126504 RepID=UPI00309DE773